jgi:hypothetical protein
VGSFQFWLETNWFNLSQTAGIVLGLLFTGFALLNDSRNRHLSNLLALKQEHRALWSVVHENPHLARILEREVDLVSAPMTNDEEIFLRQMIVHFAVAWEFIKDGVPLNADAFRKDAAEIFSLPLPKTVFERVRGAQAPDFAAFIDGALAARMNWAL